MRDLAQSAQTLACYRLKVAEANDFGPVEDNNRGGYQQQSIIDDYVDHLCGYVDFSKIKPMKLVLNAVMALPDLVDALQARFAQMGVPVEFVKVNNQPDGTFPNGIPNPILHKTVLQQ